MMKVSLMLAVATFAIGDDLIAQETRPAPSTPASKPAAEDRSEDAKAIHALRDEFTRAFNAGDAAAAAATYTETAIVVGEEGERIEGRAAIQEQYAASFAENPGHKIELRVESFRFLGPETALEEGRATIKPEEGKGAPEITRFTAIYVKIRGHWLQSAVRDETSKELTAHDRLKALEWMVGDWINESQDALVQTTCKWTADGNFLVREFTMKTKGEAVLSGTQRIGWDPVRSQFKMWIFDSEGGFGEGYWTRDGDRWVIKAEGVRQDGLHASATNIITKLGKDRASWQSLDRTLGGAAIPGIDEFTIVRKAPEAGK